MHVMLPSLIMGVILIQENNPGAFNRHQWVLEHQAQLFQGDNNVLPGEKKITCWVGLFFFFLQCNFSNPALGDGFECISDNIKLGFTWCPFCLWKCEREKWDNGWDVAGRRYKPHVFYWLSLFPVFVNHFLVHGMYKICSFFRTGCSFSTKKLWYPLKYIWVSLKVM